VKLGNFGPVVTLVSVFLLGGVAGAGVAAAYVHREVGDFVSEPRFRERARIRGLTRLLDLSDAQRDRVKAVMENHHRQRQAAYAEMIDKCGRPVKDEKQRMDAEIRVILTPPQQDRFDALTRRQDERLFIRGPGVP
jgi:Spy/CpxP family protein refolding chaperone